MSSTRFPLPSSHPFGSAWEANGFTLVLTSGSSRRGTGRDLGLGSLQPPPALQLIFKELISPFINRGFLALSPLLIVATECRIPSLLHVLHLHPTPRTGFSLPPFRVPTSPTSSVLLLCPNWSLVVCGVWVSCLTSLRNMVHSKREFLHHQRIWENPGHHFSPRDLHSLQWRILDPLQSSFVTSTRDPTFPYVHHWGFHVSGRGQLSVKIWERP